MAAAAAAADEEEDAAAAADEKDDEDEDEFVSLDMAFPPPLPAAADGSIIKLSW